MNMYIRHCRNVQHSRGQLWDRFELNPQKACYGDSRFAVFRIQDLCSVRWYASQHWLGPDINDEPCLPLQTEIARKLQALGHLRKIRNQINDCQRMCWVRRF